MDLTALEKKGSWHNPQHAGWPIRRSIPIFSLKPTNEAVSLSQASVDNKLLGLLGLYHQHAIGTFNTYSRGPTHWFLTDTGRGYSLKGAGFAHTTPRPSQLTVFTFHLRALPGPQFNEVLSTKPESIGADMPDHNRWQSRAPLFRHVLMNTRRHALEV
jgi:hypothetical protein